MLQSNVGVNDSRVQPEVVMDDSNDAITQQAAVREEFLSPTEKWQGTTTWATEQHKLFDGGRFLYAITFLKREIFACILSCLFFSACCIFVCAVYRVFSRFVHKLPKQVR